MEPVSTTSLIGAGISALSAGGTAAATGAQNRKSRAFSREMYEKQKADNIAFWNMQNEYNSPQMQMQRLKNAGLNPNMLYDKTGAVIPAGNINTPDVQSAQFRTPDFGSVGSGLVQGYFDTKIKQAQYDNLRAANTVAHQEAILKAAQAAGEVKRTEGQGYLNDFSRQNLSNSLEAAKIDTEQKKANVQFTFNADERAAASNSKSLEEATQRIINMRTQNINDAETLKVIKSNLMSMQVQREIAILDRDMKAKGLQPTDELWQRALGRILDNVMPGGLPSVGDSLWKYAKKTWDDWWK